MSPCLSHETRSDAKSHLTPARRLCALSLFVLSSLASCRGETERWNILVLVPDTLRADHISGNGYGKVTSPNLDALSAEGVNFTQAVTAAPQTWQSYVTILTGLYPPHHGVRYIYDNPLSPEVASIGVLLGNVGYETAAFDTIPFLKGMTGGHGFAEYVLADRTSESRNRDQVLLDQVWEWMSRPREAPFFAFVRLMGAHWPYDKDLFLGEFEIDQNLDHDFNRGGYGVRGGEAGEGLQLTDAEAHRRMVFMPERFEKQRAHIIAHYDAEIRELDEHIGRLLSRMREMGLLERTIVVITSDHGENFGENGYMQHGPRLDDAVMRVPLIFRLPDDYVDRPAGVEINSQVRTVDLLPTVLEAAGVRVPPALDGVSLIPAMSGESLGELPAYGESGRSFVGTDPELYLPGVLGKHRMVRTPDWKLVWIPGRKAGELQLYHLRVDRGERQDVAESHPETVTSLRAYLLSVLEREREWTEERSLGSEELRMLRSLGYVP